ncbi:MAG: nucleoside monophosphate kinase [Capsulimonadales bacterium]|nr:nucleoside monophosphate kinase [Capsulimonadales bacterium]
MPGTLTGTENVPDIYPPRHPRYRSILLFGAPGAGKGTVGKALGSVPGFVHVACGDVFRNLDYTSPIGQEFIRYSSKGLLVPDDTTIALWEAFIDGLVTTHVFVPSRDFLVLDGIPRNVEQASMLEKYIDVSRIFYLICSDEELMMERLRRRALKENRLDDASDEVIRRRWRVYEEESRPVLDFYAPERIVQVDAIGTPARVLHAILTRLIADGA